jgi:hypothetical protein
MIPTDNYSSRFGERVRILALHDTEGARDVISLGAFFQRINNASYHGAVDDFKYEAYVDYSYAAWHMLNANQESDSLSLCGFAAWTRDEWFSHSRMLDLAAAWLAERANARKLPLRHLNDQEIRDCMANRNHPGGIVMHRDYTRATQDGTHTDLGGNFPIDDVIIKARRIAIAHGLKAYPKGDEMVQLPPVENRVDFQILIDPDNEHRLMLTSNTDLSKNTSKVFGIYAIQNVDAKTAPKLSKVLEKADGAIFPQWWPMIAALPPGTTSVIVNYVSPVAGMVARPLP